MATQLTETTFSSTYKDDYADSDNYYRILFNSGRALQARELTQMQTIIQKEIARFARNIFLEGAVVSPGGVTLNTSYEYIKLDTSANPLPSNPQTLVGKTLTVKTPNPAIKVKVIEFAAADENTNSPATLYVQYTDTSAGAAGPTAIRVPSGATLENATITDLKVAAVDAVGRGSVVSVASGEYFTQEHFVYCPSQTIFLDRYSSTPTKEIGFKVFEEVVTTDDTSALYDNQGAQPNEASPGADRYRIRLVLTTKDQIDSDENFVYLAKIVNGVIVHTSDGKSDYNKITELVAQRTREESGDYVVKDFRARFNEIEGNDSNLSIDVSAGIAYVDGYRLEVPASKITIPKARDTYTEENETIVAQYGNWIRGTTSDNKGLPNIEQFQQVTLKSGTNFGSITLGTARVRYIEEDGANLRFYLFDINMNPTRSFRSVSSFGTSDSDYVNVIKTDGIAQLNNTNNNTLLWPLGKTKPLSDGVSVDSITVQRRQLVTTGSGVTTATLTAETGYSFVNLTQWIISPVGGTVSSTSGVSITGGGATANFTGLTPSTNYEVITLETYGSPVSRQKTLQSNQTFTKKFPDSADSDGFGLRWLSFDLPDIYKVKRIRRDDSDGTDMASFFDFDNGQRDNFYDIGRLIAKQGLSIPSGQVYVKFDYFGHQSGQFFSVNSYNGIIDYKDIPSYRKTNGETVSLRDVLDFRSVKTAGGNFSATVNYIPGPTVGITADIDYYLPRNDKLVVVNEGLEVNRTRTATVKLIQGISSIEPQYPSAPDGSLAIYNIALNPYTLSDSDLSTEIISNKRFTMKDIARLEKRIDGLVELTTLSLLETNTAILDVLDSNGNNRTKSGFIADNFTNYAYSDIANQEYRAAIDQASNTLTPSFITKNIRLFFDSDNVSNSNVAKHGDLLTLDYTNQVLFDQNLATETININPFSVITGRGHMRLSPASDEWFETQYAPDRIVSGGDRAIFTGEQVWTTNRNLLMSQWYGTDGTQVITGSRTVREQIGDKIIDVQFIPWMRSKKIAFTVNGLRPNSRYFAFFNDTSVDNWVREEDDFYNYSNDDTDYGNLYSTATEHPDGSTDLYSDANGVLHGSFFIPSTSSVRFRTGEAILKLLDISVNDITAALSSAGATFVSTGILNTRQRTIQTVRELDVASINIIVPPPVVDLGRSMGDWMDPLAQSFLISRSEHPNGVFITKVDAYIATKEEIGGPPLSCEIRLMNNGYPSNIAIPGAVKYLLPTEVTVPTNVDDLTSVRAAPTTFEFDEPIYLPPGEYAIVLLAETTAYTAYIAKTYDFVLGTTAARVSKQPALGSLFKSQNGSTWTADQTSDLMFKLHRAEFATSGTAIFENGALPAQKLQANPLQFFNGDSDIRVFHPGHGFILNDGIIIDGLPTGDSSSGIEHFAINGKRAITSVDHTGYTFGAAKGYRANATALGGGSNITVTPNVMFDEFIPIMQTMTPDATSIVPKARITSGASYADGRNLAANDAYKKQVAYSDVVLNELNYLNSPAIIASPENELRKLGSGNKSFSMQMTFSTADRKVSPIIDLQRASITTVENVIDKQDASATSGYNVPLEFVAETDPKSGTSAAKHITSQVSLIEEAVGLKIIIAANRPAQADFAVYYRTASGDNPLSDESWVLVNRIAELPTDEDPSIFREYEYLAGGLGGELIAFTKFQIKLVMTSTNSSKIPTIKDLRAIALAV